MNRQIISLSQFKTTATKILGNLKKTHNHVILTQNGTATAVVQDFDTFQNNEKALYLLKLMVQGEADIRDGNLVDQAAVFRNIRDKLQASNEEISG